MFDICKCVFRNAGEEEYHRLPMLPRAIRGRNLYHSNKEAYAVLLFQPDSSLRADLVNGVAGFHSAAGFWRKIDSRYMLMLYVALCVCTPVLCGCRLTHWPC